MTDLPQQADHSPWQLVFYDGPNAGEVYPVTGETLTIGRELDNEISVDDLQVSRYHARLTREGQQLIVEDLDSVNGTLVNNELITEPYALQPDDTVSLGPVTFKAERSASNLSQSRTQTRVTPRVQTPPQPPPKLWPAWLLAGVVLGLLVIILLAMLVIRWFTVSESSTVTDVPTVSTDAVAVPTIVINQAPSERSQVQINQAVNMQAVASDPSGITRMALWVNGRQVDQLANPLPQRATSMTAVFRWSADAPGRYVLEIRAYNQSGLVSAIPVTTLTAIGSPDTPTPVPTDTPTPTITPLPPSPTPTATPTATTTPILATPTPRLALLMPNLPVLNVRSGPGTQYSRIGQLEQGDQVEIVGQANSKEGQWWQIKFDAAPGGLGWVAANPDFITVLNIGGVPVVATPALPTATPSRVPIPTPAPTATAPTVIRPPDGKTLLIVGNRSLINQPARLTLSGGKSVGGGREIDPPPNEEIQLVLEPDFYRAIWSAPWNSFARGEEFTAVAGKVMVMWIVPEHGLTGTEVYDELIVGGAPVPTPASPTAASSSSAPGGYTAPLGKALLIAGNRSLLNNYARLTISGGSFAGGQEFTLDANTETPIEMLPGDYHAIWSTPARGNFSAGRDFTVSAGEVLVSWIIPEDGQVFMQFPGQAPQQINN